ncbi:putative F-box/LRR-repeat protein at3g58880 [Phtheirospermum japonicum]|uniref:Putative F-box/LRR-repeat protein at3g58880 n=1 Tax=Phtheirospermum japonicum TaxID=374723 RepID=A0A830BX44_9LAMI|nr:putative F-box/LRR-repeat protein at3g58880 [Phtheirospermum japonicum]
MEEGTHKVDDEAPHSIGINELPNDAIVEIVSRLSRMNRREAVRTSVLSRRWRYLSSFCSLPVTLVLDYRDLLPSDYMREKFIEWVDRVLRLHQDKSLDALIIRSTSLQCRFIYDYLPTRRREDRETGDADSWIYLAMHKKVRIFEFECPRYEFPNVGMLSSHLHGINSFAFVSLSFVDVRIEDEVVHYFLAKCPHLEKLCIRNSERIENLKVVDPRPNVKVLEISNCLYINSLKISVTSLVSCTFEGDRIIFPFKENPNLSEITLGGNIARSFIYEPKKHASYSDKLEKLGLNILNMVGYQPPSQRSHHIYYHNNGGSESSDSFLRIQRPDLPRLCSLKHLELNLMLPVGKSIHFFVKFINGSPLLKELRIKISYMVTDPRSDEKLGFPEESPSTTVDRGRHKNLKVVKMSGYVGCSIDDKFILRLLNIAQSLKTVAIDTESEYYDQKPWDCTTQCPKERRGPCGFCTTRDIGARTRIEAIRRAKLLKLSFPPKAKAVLIVT